MCSTFRSRASSTALLIGDLSLSVYNALGQEIDILINEDKPLKADYI
jgi:hypothetical protein